MNKELLLKVADAIEANPEHFDMEWWFDTGNCGTTACIAGWAFHLSKNYKKLSTSRSKFFEHYGFETVPGICNLLQIEKESINSLIQVGDWKDRELRLKYISGNIPEVKAKAAAEYIRWFVETQSNETL